MIHTEDEAGSIRCCGPEGCGSNPNFYERMCIASACMGWEWGKDGWRRADGIVINADREPENYSGGRWIKRGDCGLKRVKP